MISFLLSCSTAPPPPRPLPVASVPREGIADPDERFASLCAPCHGEAGRGDGPVADAFGGVADVNTACTATDDALIQLILSGGQRMPPMAEGLFPGDVEALLVAVRERQDCTEPTITADWCGILDLTEARCLPCHAAAVNSGGLDLQTDPAATLIDVPSSQWPDSVRVMPGEPSSSLFYLKLVAEQGEKGQPMPMGSPLDDATTAQVAAWIQAGASMDCNP